MGPDADAGKSGLTVLSMSQVRGNLGGQYRLNWGGCRISVRAGLPVSRRRVFLSAHRNQAIFTFSFFRQPICFDFRVYYSTSLHEAWLATSGF
jgi:hypothetical protein